MMASGLRHGLRLATQASPERSSLCLAQRTGGPGGFDPREELRAKLLQFLIAIFLGPESEVPFHLQESERR